jgi:CRP-like cAMP-binding protein
LIPQPIDQVPLFLRLTDSERELVTARLRRKQVAADELIFAAGATSDAMYVITSGRVRLEGGNNGSVTLANLGSGSLLGEEDMLLDRPYSATARAAATTQLYVFSRTDLEDVVGQRPSIGLKFSAALGLRISFLEQYLIHHRLRNSELLSSLSEQDLGAISGKLDFRTATRGDLIIEAGAPGETAFFVEEGKARLISASNEGDSYEELDEGALFGHTALITGKPYSASVRAVTDVSLWALARAAYQDLIQDHPAIKLAFSRALAESLSTNDQTEAMDQMRQLQLFSDVPTEALSALTARLVLRHYPAEEAIYTEGTPGDAMYIVDSGEVRLMDHAFADAHLLERMRAGDSFGEMALLTGRTRAECARAASDTTLWVLYKTDFDDAMVQYPEISLSLSRALTERLSNRESDFVIRHLRRIDLFANLASSELKQISRQVHGLRFRPGEIICFAGQPSQALFMIEMGEVKRMGAGPNGEPLMLDILGPGDAIGVQEIVQNAPYSATAQSIDEVELWTIDKSHFQRMMETYPALAITITRLLADRLMRSQQMPQPPMRGQPRGGVPPLAPRGPARQMPGSIPAAPRPPTRPASVPPPGARIQQPQSGARAIKPTPRKPFVPTTPTPVQPAANINVSSPASNNVTKPATGAKINSTHFQAPHLGMPHLPHIDKPQMPTPQKPQVQAPPLIPPVSHQQARHLPHFQAPHLQAPHLPTPQMPHLQTPHVQRRHSPTFLNEFGTWASNLSWGARLRVVASGALLLWLVFITFPITTVTTVSSAVAGLQLSNQPKSSSQGVQLVRSASDSSGGKAKVAYAVSTETPVPTKTPQPTATPKPRPTSAPATRIPTAIPVAAAPAAPVIPPLPPVEWDPRLGTGPQVLPHLENVRLIPAQVGHGQKFWRAVKVKFENIDESGSDHTIYVKILDESGKRVDGKKLQVTSDTSGEVFPDQPTEKSADDMCDCNFNYPMYGDGYDVQIIDGLPSDKVGGMVMPMRRHVNYKITFQLSTNP